MDWTLENKTKKFGISGRDRETKLNPLFLANVIVDYTMKMKCLFWIFLII